MVVRIDRMLAAAVLVAFPLEAQEPARSDAVPAAGAVRNAVDAFGERVGIDQVGLYSEYSTRGFDLLATSGAFRMGGFYFSPAALPSESLIDGSSVHVGIAATALDLPSPTGVIGYRLREPAEHDALRVTTGLRDEKTVHVEALGTLTGDEGRWGVVGHMLVAPDSNRGTGEDGPTVTGALVARWRPDAATTVRLFGSYGLDRHDGDIAVVAEAPGVPPALRARHHYEPDWARVRIRGGNTGLLAERRWGGWSAGAGLIRSVNHVDRDDVAVLAVDRAGNVASTLYSTPAVTSRSDSAEVKLARDFRWAGLQHRIGVAVRGRHTITGRAEATLFDAGRFTLDDGPIEVARPTLPIEGPRGRDLVEQRIASLSYGLQWLDRVQLRLGAHASDYRKTVDDFGGGRTRRHDRSWLYSASAVWQPTGCFRLFASYVSGLEESGVAPSAARNRGEVLPPVTARQVELGGRYSVTPGLDLIVAGFDIRKPVYGLRPDALYAPVGTVRHRGVEASLTGKLTPTTTVVIGANRLEPRIRGELVDAGLVRPEAPGVSRINATLSFDQQLARGWSADAYLLYEGKRRRDGSGDTIVPGVPFFFAGSRYSWTAGKTPLTLRGQVVNVLDRQGYYATPYGPLVPIAPRTFRLLLSADF